MQDEAKSGSYISIERLAWLCSEIKQGLKSPRDTSFEEIKGFLSGIVAHPDYQSFLAEGQFKYLDDGPARFHVPPEIIGRHPRAFRQLSHSKCGLVSAFRRLELNIIEHCGALVLADGLWVPQSERTFLYADESKQLSDYIVSHGYEAEFDDLIDPACGAGAHALALGFRRSICLDASVRSVAFANLNAVLNGANRWLLGINDIHQGLPPSLSSLKSALIVANMAVEMPPIVDSTEAESGLSSGHGMRLPSAVVAAANSLWKQSTTLSRLMVVILFQCPGHTKQGPWEIEEIARKVAPSAKAYAFVLGEVMIWRVNGRRTSANPMPLSRLEDKAQCRLTFRKAEEDQARRGYRAVQEELEHNEWSHLGYGILELEFRR